TITASAGTGVAAIRYSASQDRLYMLLVGAMAIDVVNPTTKAIATTISLSGVWTTNATTTANLWVHEIPGTLIAFPNNTTDLAYVVSTATNTIVGSLSSSTVHVKSIYHTGTNKYFLFGPTQIASYNATTRAAGGTGGLTTITAIVDDPAAANVTIFTQDNKMWTLNPSTMGLTSVVAPSYGGVSVVSSASPYACSHVPPKIGGAYYLLTASSRYVVGYDGTSLTGEGCDGSPDAASIVCYDAVHAYLFIYSPSYGLLTRRLAATPSCLDTFAITGTVESTQVVQKGVGTVPVLMAGQRVQIRETAALEYKTRFADPVAVATYGAIDATPTLPVNALCNWFRGGAFEEWRADNTSPRITTLSTTTSVYNGITSQLFDQRWRVAEYAAGLTGITVTANYALNDLTITVGNLGAGRVLQPGDILYLTGDSIFQNRMFVRRRTVADGSGNAVVPVTPRPAGITAGAGTLTLVTVDPGLAEGQTDCVVSMPEAAAQGVRPLLFSAPVPKIVGDATAWVTVHIKFICNNVIPSNLRLSVTPPFGGTALNDSPADTVTVSDLSLREYWLSQRVDLTSWPTTDGHIYASIGVASGAPSCTLYVQSASIVLCPSSPVTDDVGFDLFASEFPNALVSLAHLRRLQGGAPSVRYACTVAEDDPARPFAIGASVRLHDPARSITARPRIVSVTHFGSEVTDDKVPRPVIELSSAPLSLLRAITTLEANAA
ncbi:MAG TPA: hypothetical protein VIR54_27025, partial [Vicinamibacterales bacterium]